MKPLFYCLECDHEFESAAWNGDAAVCPECGSTRWYDIEEEREEKVMKRKPALPSEECPFP